MAYTAIDDPSAYFKVQLYTGTGSGGSDRQITFDDTDTDMQPDLVWIKNRDSSQEHVLVDSVRGATKDLDSSETTAEATTSTRVGSFLSDGFQLGSGSLQNRVNGSSHKMVAWCWKESATAGFDIVSYTGNGTDDTDISHNLSAVPKMIVVKNRDAADAWQIYHGANTSAPETDYMVLDTTAATADAADRWSDEAPTSSVFTLGDGDEVNTDTENYIAYCFAPKQGYSAMGSYIGNGSTDGSTIWTGMRISFLMVKATSATSAWYIYDNKRAGYNPDNNQLYPDRNNAEDTTDQVDLLSNGFKWRTTGDPNSSGRTYVYMAFAEAPFVNSNGVPCNAR